MAVDATEKSYFCKINIVMAMELVIQKIVKENDKEYVLFRVEEDCNLWPFILFDATYDENGNSSNLLRHSTRAKEKMPNIKTKQVQRPGLIIGDLMRMFGAIRETKLC